MHLGSRAMKTLGEGIAADIAEGESSGKFAQRAASKVARREHL